MCRYAEHIYKCHFACFQCRKMFRQPSNADLPEARRPAPNEQRGVPCPECQGAMQNLGWDFRAPRQSDGKQWKKVEILFRRGFAYHSCGCDGPGPRPAALRDVPAFLAEHRSRTVGEMLLQRISLTAASRRKQARQAPAGQVAAEHPLATDARRLRQRTPAAAAAASLLQKQRRSKSEPPGT